MPAVREWAAQCHEADTGLTAQRRTMAGMALPGELAEQRRGVIPRRGRSVARACRCQSIKWLGRGSRCRGDGPVGASSEANFARGGFSPRARRTSPEGGSALERGGPHPRGLSALERGGPRLRGRLGQLFRWAAWATRVAITLCVFWVCGLVCVCVFYEIRWVFPGCLGDPYGCPRHRAPANVRTLIAPVGGAGMGAASP
jgi:hypothetical protein